VGSLKREPFYTILEDIWILEGVFYIREAYL
jgi:hypothetical protein